MINGDNFCLFLAEMESSGKLLMCRIKLTFFPHPILITHGDPRSTRFLLLPKWKRKMFIHISNKYKCLTGYRGSLKLGAQKLNMVRKEVVWLLIRPKLLHIWYVLKWNYIKVFDGILKAWTLILALKLKQDTNWFSLSILILNSNYHHFH